MEYYSHKCKCGCGGKIEKKPWHKYQGVPDYMPHHHHRCRSDETRKKMSEVKKGKVAWNKGKKGVQIAWNKGLKLPHLSGENSGRYIHGLSGTREYENNRRKKLQANDDPHYIYTRIKSKARKKGAIFEFNKDDFIEWYLTQEKICDYCGIKIVRHVGKVGPQKDSISIDRKDYSGPYSESNCVLCCMKCNVVKNDALTYEQMKEIVGPLLKQNREYEGD